MKPTEEELDPHQLKTHYVRIRANPNWRWWVFGEAKKHRVSVTTLVIEAVNTFLVEHPERLKLIAERQRKKDKDHREYAADRMAELSEVYGS